jgi:hypothetical protein
MQKTDEKKKNILQNAVGSCMGENMSDVMTRKAYKLVYDHYTTVNKNFIVVMYGMREIKINTEKEKLSFNIPSIVSDQLSVLLTDKPSALFMRCVKCGEHAHYLDVEYVGAMWYCKTCLSESKKCYNCKTWVIDTSKGKYVRTFNDGDKFCCARCFDHYFTTCKKCGQNVVSSSICAYSDGKHINTDLCKTCITDEHELCRDCGYYYRREALHEELCISCTKNRLKPKKKEVRDYFFKPSMVFVSKTTTEKDYMGFELEIAQGDIGKGQEILTDVKELYLKRDGSVPDGFEIVSYPLTLRYHIDEMNYAQLFEQLGNAGFKSHETHNCGLHVHISRDYFGDSPRKQSKNIAAFLYLFQKFRNEITIFSRRNSLHYCKFYPFPVPTTTKITKYYQRAQYFNKRDRYMVLNFQNPNTVEVRLFRGTLGYNTFIASLQLVKLFADIAISKKYTSEKALKEITWIDVKNMTGELYDGEIINSYMAKLKI